MKGNKFLIVLVIVLSLGLITEGFYMTKLSRKIRKMESTYDFDNPLPNPFLRHKFFFSRKFPYSGLSSKFDSFLNSSWNPFREMERIKREIDRMFKESFSKFTLPKNKMSYQYNSFFVPDIDIKEGKNSYIITMDIPGMDKSKIDIEIKGNNLVVSGERKEESEETTNKEKNIFYKKERSFGYFSRVIPLPDDAKKDEIKADYKKGVLRIVVPKKVTKTNTTTSRKINIL